MKGILLSGGKGTRLYPLTKIINKQLLPVYDKPMIYYSLSTLMLSGIKDILLITSEDQIKNYETLLVNGSRWGLNIEYKIQKKPEGIGQAFLIGEDFIGYDCVALVLGDNILYGSGLTGILTSSKQFVEQHNGAYIFGYKVRNPESFGVIYKDEHDKICLEEKPKNPKSNLAIPGVYFYDNTVIEKAKNLKYSNRGELEITDINKMYVEQDMLYYEIFPRGITWLDAGTHESLYDASNFVRSVQKQSSVMVACLEEIALRMSFITKDKFIELANEKEEQLKNYLLEIAYEISI
jgi:glucose-1-phosphate thymidylyltransferase